MTHLWTKEGLGVTNSQKEKNNSKKPSTHMYFDYHCLNDFNVAMERVISERKKIAQ